MEFLRKLFLQTRIHLQGLTPSQRLAIGSCAGLIAVSTFWLMSWAGKSEMVALFDQSISADEMTPIRQQLDADGVKYTVSGDRVLVPSESVLRLQAKLAQSDALPRDISYTFNKTIENASPWLPHDERDKRWNLALANELSLRLRHFNGVRDARVFLDKNAKRTIGSVPITATASIEVTMAPGRDLDKSQAKAMASFVSRAVAGLDVSNVQVTDFTSGRTFRIPRQDDLIGEDEMEIRQKKENYFAGQIRELLENIHGIRVAVRAEMDARATQITETKHGKPAVLKERSKSLESSEGRSASEPGTVANTGTPNMPTAPNSRTEENETETTFHAEQDSIRTSSTLRPYRLVNLSAAINVPRSFLAAIYKNAHQGKEPTDEELEASPSTRNELNKIRTQVETLMLKSDESGAAKSAVSVAWFHDGMYAMGGVGGLGGAAEPASALSGDNMMHYVQTYGGKAGLGALAVISLFMMLMMVRRVGEGPVLPGEEPPMDLAGRRSKKKRQEQEELEEFEVSGGPVGEAEVTEHLLVGREVDEATLRSQKLVEQVAQLIKMDPNTTVSVLQRWIDAEPK